MMSKLISIRAYEYKELNDKAKATFAHDMYEMPFDYDAEDENGNTIRKYEYFADWDLKAQIEFCELNDYLFSKYGKLIGHLEESAL